MINNTGKLFFIKSYKGNDVIYVRNRNNLPISHIGDASIVTNDEKLNIKDVLVVPELKKNLLSVGKLTSDNLFALNSPHLVLLLKTKTSGQS